MLKGKTIIELTDVNTGEKEIVEDNNMVTNAINDLFNSFPNLLNPYAIYGGTNFYNGNRTNFTSLWEWLLGGLLIFDGQIEEKAEQTYAPSNVNLVGCGIKGWQNDTKNTARGSYNQIESEFNEEQKVLKFVYDFKTSEANGTIACVALTSYEGGRTSYGNKNAEYAKASGNYNYNSHFCIFPFYLTETNSTLESNVNPCPRTFSYDKNYKKAITDKNYSVISGRCFFNTYDGGELFGYGYTEEFLFCINIDEDAVYYLKTKNMKKFSITKRKAYLNSVSVFDNPPCKGELIAEVELPELSSILSQGRADRSYCYDSAGKCLYLIGNSIVDVNASFRIVKINLSDFSNVTLQEINIKNTTGIKISCANDPSEFYARFFVSNGFMYARSHNNGNPPFDFYKIEIANPANVIKIKNNCDNVCYSWFYPQYEFNGIIYMQNGYIIKNDEIFKTEHPCFCKIGGNRVGFVTPMIKNGKASKLFYVSYGESTDSTYSSTQLFLKIPFNAICFLNNYLATINNLAAPVTKTADKTMKVTYVVQEVADDTET